MYGLNSGKVIVIKHSPNTPIESAYEKQMYRIIESILSTYPDLEPERNSVVELSHTKENSMSICSKLSFHLKNTSVIFISYAQTWLTLSHHTSRGKRLLLNNIF